MPATCRAAVDAIGTFRSVFGGCGAAVLAVALQGLLGISLAFGLTVVAMAYAIGAGCHLTRRSREDCGRAAGFRSTTLPYIIARIVGALVAGAALYLSAGGSASFDPNGGSRATRMAPIRRAGYGLGAGRLMEVAMALMFLWERRV